MKAYYTDPLAAAWMTKHFGMKFSTDSKFAANDRPIAIDDKYDKFYIHPDSLHLLEPQYNDIVLGDDYSVGTCVVRFGNPMVSTDFNIRRIMERNEIPFMWPEME